MSVCLNCERTLDEEYSEIGLCPKCLDLNFSDDVEDDEVVYGGVWDSKEQDGY